MRTVLAVQEPGEAVWLLYSSEVQQPTQQPEPKRSRRRPIDLVSGSIQSSRRDSIGKSPCYALVSSHRYPAFMHDGQVAAAVVVEDGKVLLVRRAVPEGRLSWQFPAGTVESGETAEQAAAREAFEETGLALRSVSGLGERVHPDTGRAMIYVACEVIGGVAHAASREEVAEVVWCDRESLVALIPYPIYEPVRRYLDDRLRSGVRRTLGD